MVRSSNAAYFLTIGALAGALGVAFFIARTINKPIARLIAGTDRIAHGSFDTIPVTSHDEIGLLTLAVNDMSERLKEINDLKTELMHHISHELRAPLQAMRSANDFLAEQRFGTLNNQQLRLLGFIRDGINRISRFSNQFLDIAKIESGRMEYHFSKTDILPIVAHEVDDAKLTAYRKSISIKLQSENTRLIKADVEKIGQIMSNLLTNAIKYTGEGGSIDVTVAPSEFGTKVSVKDSGVGIPADDLTKIFTKFYQAKNANKVSTKGTGVGLALVKAFAEGHGGNVSVESAVGVGTTFTVDFPAAEDESVDHPKGTPTGEPLQLTEAPV
jgi:two-component system sensor histidine kinase GlrK